MSEMESEERSPVVRLVKYFEHGVVLVLMSLLALIICLSTAELAWMLVHDVFTSRNLLLNVEEMFELFGLFLLVLIGIELLSTLKSYARSGVVHVEVVLEVALVALAQKVIVLDTSRAGGTTVLGLAALIVALSAAFFAVHAGRRSRADNR